MAFTRSRVRPPSGPPSPPPGAPASSTQQADQPGHCSNDDAGDEGPAARQHPHLEGLDVFLGGHVCQRGFDPREPFLVRRHYAPQRAARIVNIATRLPVDRRRRQVQSRRGAGRPIVPGRAAAVIRGNTGRRPRPLRACAPATSVLPSAVNRLSGCTRMAIRARSGRGYQHSELLRASRGGAARRGSGR